MATTLTPISQMGPLPITVTVNIETDEPVLLFLNASAWTGTPNSLIGVQLLIDNVAVMSAILFSNVSGQHEALVSTPTPYTPTIGSHTFTLQALNGATNTDLNDAFGVTVLY